MTRNIDSAIAAVQRAPDVMEMFGLSKFPHRLRGQMEDGFLSEGSNAMVFLFKSNPKLVMKLTFDQDQAELSKFAKKEKPKGIVPITDVYDVGVLPFGGGFAKGWLVIEKTVIPLPTMDMSDDPEEGAIADVGRAALNEVLDDPTVKPAARRGRGQAGFAWDLRKGIWWLFSHTELDPAQAAGSLDLDTEDNVGFDPDTGRMLILDLGQVEVLESEDA